MTLVLIALMAGLLVAVVAWMAKPPSLVEEARGPVTAQTGVSD